MSNDSKTAVPTLAAMTRLEPVLHKQLTSLAKKGDRTMSRQICRLVKIGLKHDTEAKEVKP